MEIESLFLPFTAYASSSRGKTGKPKIQEDFLSISEYNRPGTKLAAVNSIFVHYTANPKNSIVANRTVHNAKSTVTDMHLYIRLLRFFALRRLTAAAFTRALLQRCTVIFCNFFLLKSV